MFAEAEVLLTYGPNPSGVPRRTATYVDKILKGAKPADLPVEQPTRLPPSLLLRAGRLIP